MSMLAMGTDGQLFIMLAPRLPLFSCTKNLDLSLMYNIRDIWILFGGYASKAALLRLSMGFEELMSRVKMDGRPSVRNSTLI